MELTFNKDGNLYVTEFEVTTDFNLHLERDKGGKVSFYQRSTNGQYDTIEELEKNIDLVFDYDFQSLVWPKYIKITSESLPTVATLTTSGEVTEIKSQSKEVEIVSNGTTAVTPDAGYSYLSGVTVKVNVPQEGGGGDTPSGGGSWRYFDISSASDLYKLQIGASIGMVVKHSTAGITTPAIGMATEGGNYFNNVTAIAADWDFKITGADGNAHPFGEVMESGGITLESLASMGVTEITEEEFYTIETA